MSCGMETRATLVYEARKVREPKWNVVGVTMKQSEERG
jgi:hypothetical protein